MRRWGFPAGKNKTQARAAAWTAQQLAARNLEMEELHPGFLNCKLNLNIMLGIVMVLHLIYTAMSWMLDFGSGNLIFMLLSTAVIWGLYSTCVLRGSRLLTVVLLLLRCRDLVLSLMDTVPYLLYMNIIGIVFWQILLIRLLADIGFLACLLFSPKVREYMKYNRILYSPQEIRLQPKTAAYDNSAAAEEEKEQ